MNIKEGLTFDDVLLVPQHSEVESRSKIDLSVTLSKNIKLDMPIIPANMKTVTGFDMALFIAQQGGMAILHRFMSLDEQINILECIKEEYPQYINHIGFSVGAKEDNQTDVQEFCNRGAKIICVDIAHGDSKLGVEMTKYIAKEYPDVFLISGNVATGKGAERLWKAGADAVKVGVGPGSLCTTRIETGNGVPQLTALIDASDVRYRLTKPTYKSYPVDPDNDHNHDYEEVKYDPEINRPIFIIADGGIKNAGDCVKALCFADMVMAGNLFAGTTEAPGEILTTNGKQYKSYVGSSTHKTNHIEGVSALVPHKGPASMVLTKLLEGIKSGCSYQGVDNLTDLKESPQFVRITSAGLTESHPHDVLVIK